MERIGTSHRHMDRVQAQVVGQRGTRWTSVPRSSWRGRAITRRSRRLSVARSAVRTPSPVSCSGTRSLHAMLSRRRSSERGAICPVCATPERFEAWLYRLTLRACVDEARRRRRRVIQVELSPIQLAPTADPADEVGDQEELETAFAALDADHRALILMHVYVGIPVPEAAAALGIPLGTAKSRISRALVQMRRAMRTAPIPARSVWRDGSQPRRLDDGRWAHRAGRHTHARLRRRCHRHDRARAPASRLDLRRAVAHDGGVEPCSAAWGGCCDARPGDARRAAALGRLATGAHKAPGRQRAGGGFHL